MHLFYWRPCRVLLHKRWESVTWQNCATSRIVETPTQEKPSWTVIREVLGPSGRKQWRAPMTIVSGMLFRHAEFNRNVDSKDFHSSKWQAQPGFLYSGMVLPTDANLWTDEELVRQRVPARLSKEEVTLWDIWLVALVPVAPTGVDWKFHFPSPNGSMPNMVQLLNMNYLYLYNYK